MKKHTPCLVCGAPTVDCLYLNEALLDQTQELLDKTQELVKLRAVVNAHHRVLVLTELLND